MFASENILSADRDQIAQQLELLGYAPGEKVFLRAFYPSDDPRKSNDKGRKTEARTTELIAQAAEKLQSDGRGIYLVVNGGGQKDLDVKACRAIFYEHDNLPKEIQLDLWRSLGLPEPTFQIDTGGKSIHSYWVFDQLIDPTHWRILQADLLEFADADRSLKNPSRVMRLAGCYHISAKGAHLTTIVNASGARYSFDKLRAIIPHKHNSHSVEKISQVDNTGDVPLSLCLSISERNTLKDGVKEGVRNATGAALSRGLIGAESRLLYLGERFSEDPRQLFDDYCARCNPPLDAREACQIWRSAQKDNPTATLSDDAILNCIKAWKRQQVAPVQKKNSVENAIVNVDNGVLSTPDVDNKNGSRSDIQAIVTTVNAILGGYTLLGEQSNALDQFYLDITTKSRLDRKVFDRIVAQHP